MQVELWSSEIISSAARGGSGCILRARDVLGLAWIFCSTYACCHNMIHFLSATFIEYQLAACFGDWNSSQLFVQEMGMSPVLAWLLPCLSSGANSGQRLIKDDKVCLGSVSTQRATCVQPPYWKGTGGEEILLEGDQYHERQFP